MAEEKEQLKIEAELDTSKLKQEAKSGLGEVANETKKVENQAKQASKAIDDIGTSANKAAQKGTQALKQMGKEAEETAKKVNRLAKLDTSVGNIKLGQAIGLANQFANSDTGKAIGGYLANQVGMSSDMQGLASSALSGGLAGASMGAMLGGPMGAAVGGLVGAGAGLLSAAKEQEKAAAALIESADKRQAFNRDRTKEIDRQEAEAKRQKGIEDKVSSLISSGDFEGARKLLAEETANAQKRFELGDKGIRNAAIQMDAVAPENRGAAYKSYDDYLTMRQGAKAEMDKYGNMGKMIDAAEQRSKEAVQAKANKEAEDARRKAEQEAVARKRQEEKDANEARKAQETADKEALAGLKEEKSGLDKELESALNIGRGYKLTDSLTNVGGGSGYYAQMSGVNTYVKDISTTLKESMKTVIARMDSIISRQAQAEVAVYAE